MVPDDHQNSLGKCDKKIEELNRPHFEQTIKFILTFLLALLLFWFSKRCFHLVEKYAELRQGGLGRS